MIIKLEKKSENGTVIKTHTTSLKQACKNAGINFTSFSENDKVLLEDYYSQYWDTISFEEGEQ